MILVPSKKICSISYFNVEKIFRQNFEIESRQPKFLEYILDWVKNKNGDIISPFVKCRPARPEDRDWEKVRIYQMPKTQYRNLDVCGIDGYNFDKTIQGKSLGGILVLRRNYLLHDKDTLEPGRVPILAYRERPPRKEFFWEIGLKIAFLYNLQKNVMIGTDSDSMINYFKNNGGKKFLSPRPRSFDSMNTTLTNEYGFAVNPGTKPKLISLGQSWIEDNIQYSWFKDLNIELAAYDDTKIDSDWDLADALFNALARDIDMKRTPEINDDKIDTQYDSMKYEYDEEGHLMAIQQKRKGEESKKDNFERKNSWDSMFYHPENKKENESDSFEM